MSWCLDGWNIFGRAPRVDQQKNMEIFLSKTPCVMGFHPEIYRRKSNKKWDSSRAKLWHRKQGARIKPAAHMFKQFYGTGEMIQPKNFQVQLGKQLHLLKPLDQKCCIGAASADHPWSSVAHMRTWEREDMWSIRIFYSKKNWVILNRNSGYPKTPGWYLPSLWWFPGYPRHEFCSRGKKSRFHPSDDQSW